MRRVSDAFLLNMAEVSATLIGLFLVGVFFYVETGFRRLDHARRVFEPYLRAGSRITLIVFAIPLGLSLTLIALETVWVRVLFVLLSLILLAANVDSAVRIRGITKVTGSTALLVNEVVATVMTIGLIAIPWILGGVRPDREELTWSILLAFAAGFLSITATVMSAFDVARLEASDRFRSTADDGSLGEARQVERGTEAGGEWKGDDMNLNSILIGSEDPDRLVQYYTQLFGAPSWEGGDFKSWQVGGGWLTVGPHDHVKGKNVHPGRLIWNIEAPDVKGEFERLRGAGATVVQEPYHPGEEPEGWIATFSDPDDNYFQLISPMSPAG